MIGALTLSACGARSSLLDVDSWLEDAHREQESPIDAGASAPLDPAHDEVCGKGLHGPRMVVIPVPDVGSFCIDSTEVSIRQYRAFLQAEFPFSNQPSYCAWNKSYDSWQPAGWGAGRPPPAPDDYPTNALDWCDAYSYCAWAGKRLCGKIGGGHLVNENPNSSIELHPTQGEWTYACSAGGTRAYPYGNVYDATACVTQGYDGDPNFHQYTDLPQPIGEAKKCVGGFPGMSRIL
jgi:formylglycine-generating enzyme required for sulfatase activity